MDEGRSGDDAADLALEFVGHNKEVLVVGPITVALAERLARQGCTVFVGDFGDDTLRHEVEQESFDAVLLTDALAGVPDPLSSLSSAARKLKPSGELVAWLPNVAHGDTRAALREGRFCYGQHGLLDGDRIGRFTLHASRDLFVGAGLVIVDTARVIVPLVEPQFGVTRNETRPERLHELMDDPEVETYEFVFRAVRDNGDRALADLARRVDDLSDRARDETTRTALLRSELWQTELLILDLECHRKLVGEQKRVIEEQQEYIEALTGHVSGLEHNVEMLTRSLEALRRSSAATAAKTPAPSARRTVRAAAPIRRIAEKFTPKRKGS